VSTAYISDEHPDTRGRLQEESRFVLRVFKYYYFKHYYKSIGLNDDRGEIPPHRAVVNVGFSLLSYSLIGILNYFKFLA